MANLQNTKSKSFLESQLLPILLSFTSLVLSIASLLTKRSVISFILCFLAVLIIIIVAFIFGHKKGYRVLSYTDKLKYISSVTEYVFKRVEKKICVSNKYNKEITELLKILPPYSPEFLCSFSDSIKEKELCRSSIACTAGYKKVHDLEEIAMLFPLFAKLNYNRKWLMPIFGVRDLKLFCNEFTELTLKYWDNFVVNEDIGKIKDTKYLFITWDLTNIEKWNPSRTNDDKLIDAIRKLLLSLKDKTQNNELVVDRLLILPNDVFSDSSKKEILKGITEKYFLIKSDENNHSRIPDNYRINYVIENDLQILKEIEMEFIKDVGLFSFNLLKKNSEQRFPAFLLPKDYFCIQFSHNVNLNTEKFLYLFVVERKSDGVEEFYDNFIRKIIEIAEKIRKKSIRFTEEVIK
ncbi:MAG: hypothetical protein ACTSPV_19790 [Candidatus Hodarchaeales archaeon]